MTGKTGNLGGPLADAIADALHKRDLFSAEHLAESRFAERVGTIEFLEQEGAEFIAKAFKDILQDDDVPDALKVILSQVKEPEQPVALAAIVPILAALGWMLAQAALVGPMSRLSTVSMRNFGDLKPDAAWAAEMAARNRITRDQFEAWKNDNGFTEVDGDLLIAGARQVLTPGEAMAAYRRDIISQGEFNNFLQLSGIDDDSRRVMYAMRLGPPGAAEYMNAATENQLTAEQAKAGLAANGIDPSNYEWLYETNGQSPGIEVLNRLKNYGLIDDAMYESGILESPIKNKYVEVLKQSRFRRPPMEQTLTMLRRGVIDRAKGIEYLLFNGYFPDDAENLVDYALTGKAETTKELSVSQTTTLYQEQMIDRGAAETRITGMGYDAEEAKLILDLADQRRERMRLNQSINRVHTRYVTRQLDRVSAVSALDRLAVPPTMREELLENWDVEFDVQIKHLTVADLAKGAQAGLLQPSEVRSRLLAMGYPEREADIIMVIREITPVVDEEASKELNKAEIKAAIKATALTYEEGLQRIMAMGYSQANAELILVGLKPE